MDGHKRQIQWMVLSGIALLAWSLPHASRAADSRLLPRVESAGPYTYVNGGIGEPEATAMKAEAHHRNLTLLFTARLGARNAYLAHVHVVIRPLNGDASLVLDAAGPYVLIDLPPGRYEVTAESGHSVKSRTLTVVAGARQQAVFEWPSREIE